MLAEESIERSLSPSTRESLVLFNAGKTYAIQDTPANVIRSPLSLPRIACGSLSLTCRAAHARRALLRCYGVWLSALNTSSRPAP